MLGQIISNRYYKTLGTRVINSPLSPPFLALMDCTIPVLNTEKFTILPEILRDKTMDDKFI